MRPKLAEGLGALTLCIGSVCAPQKLFSVFPVAFAMWSLLKASSHDSLNLKINLVRKDALCINSAEADGKEERKEWSCLEGESQPAKLSHYV